MPKKTSRTKPTQQPSYLRRFVGRHQVLSAIVIIIALFTILIFTLFAVREYSQAQERLHFKQIKEDLLTLQQRLNAEGEGWEYKEGCRHSGGGFQGDIRACGLGVDREYPVADQHAVDEIIKKVGPLLTRASEGLFKPEGGNYSARPPQFVMASITEARGESVASSGGNIVSVRLGNSVDCSYGYNLTTVLADKSAKLSIDLGCDDYVFQTYFDDPSLTPGAFRHKAEYPL